MRYTRANSPDWAEFKPGAQDLAMDEIAILWATDSETRNAFLLEWLGAHGFTNRHGQSVQLSAPSDIGKLTPLQFDWLRQSLVEWTRDEALVPEA